MAETLKTCTGFMSVRTDESGRRVWQSFRRNQPLNAPTESVRDALAVAGSVFGRVTLAVWDGDRGEFTGELTAGPAEGAPGHAKGDDVDPDFYCECGLAWDEHRRAE